VPLFLFPVGSGVVTQFFIVVCIDIVGFSVD
jgi:hypothetical protein